MATKSPTPSEKTDHLRPRRSTDKRGGKIDPEGVSPAGRSPHRRAYRRGVPQEPPTPDFGKATRKTGSHLEETMRSNFIEPPVVGPMGDSRSMENPIK